MFYSPDSPRVALTIGKSTVQCPAPYSEGHTITAGEAKVLNQVLRENLRNNLAPQAKEGEEISQEAFDAYYDKYEFGVRTGGGGRTADPVERKSRQMAKEKIAAALKVRNQKIDTTTDEGKATMESLIAQVLTKYPEIRKEAERQVKAEAKVAGDLLDSLGGAPQGGEALAA